MRKVWGLFLLVHFLISASHGESCDHQWQQLDSTPYQSSLFTDSNNAYWRIRFRLPKNSKIALRFRGRFSYSRYMSFNVYDQATLNSQYSLADFNIQPDSGNLNPFLPDASRGSENRNYTVWVVPSDMKDKFSSYSNVMGYPVTQKESAFQYLEVWYRVYFPDIFSDGNGNVSLPHIESFDPDTMNAKECPERGEIQPPGLSLTNSPPTASEGDVFFYRSAGANIYSLPDNQYLTSRLTRKKNEVYAFKFRNPQFSNTYFEHDKFNADTQIRYWSLCLSGVNGVTGECLADSKAKISHDGFVNIVVGQEEYRKEIESLGFNFISRGNFTLPVIIYRNLLSRNDFEGNLDKIPIWFPQGLNQVADPKLFAAHHFIGDYAPRGAYCSWSEFIKNYCGVSFSF